MTPHVRQTRKQKVGALTTLTVVGGSIVMNGTAVQALSPVVTTLDDNVTAGDGETTLREALYAVDGESGSHTITFAPELSGVIDLNRPIFVAAGTTTVQGPGSDQITLRNSSGDVLYLYGGASNRTFSGLTIDSTGRGIDAEEAGTLVLDDIVLSNNGDTGVYMKNARVTIRNSVITGSTNAGIDFRATSNSSDLDSLTLENVTISNNGGAGIDADDADRISVTDSSIADNGGAGIVAANSVRVDVTDSTISGHRNGPGIEFLIAANNNYPVGRLDVTRSTISGNTGTGVGAINTYRVNSTLENATLSGNTGDSVVVVKAGDIAVEHSTISGNTGNGSAISLVGSANDLTVDHSIISDNGAMGTVALDPGSGPQRANWSLLGTDVTNEFDDPASGDNVATDDPGLAPLAAIGGPTETLRPDDDSAALDSGDTDLSGAPETDQTGAPRQIGRVDIGAVEREVNGLVVTTNASAANDGETSLSEAVVVANSDADASNITFDPNVVGTITLDDGLTITADTTITGPGSTDLSITAPGATVIEVDGAGIDLAASGLTITDSALGIDATSTAGGSVDLDDVAISGSASSAVRVADLVRLDVSDSDLSGNGSAGITAENTPVVVDSTTIDANGGTSPFGGGIQLSGTSGAAITDSAITNNVGASGGGVRLETGGLDVTNSTISGNSASSSVGLPFDADRGIGGGIAVFGGAGSITITESTIADNTADVSGAGLSLQGDPLAAASLDVIRSTISGNTTVGNGAGLDVSDADVLVVNSTISANVAGSGASGIEVDDGTLVAEHSTISANTTTGSAVGVAVDDASADFAHVVLADNDTDDFVSTGSFAATASFSVIENTSLADFSGSDNIGTDDARLGALADNGGPTETMLPAVGSPVVDAGDATINSAPATDQRGEARIIDTIDIGAVEAPVVPVPGVIDIAPGSITVDEDAGTLTFTVTRSDGSLGAASVDVGTVDGTADLDDFTGIATTVSWADGEDGDRTVTVDILDDTDIEIDEEFTVELGNFTGAAAGSTTTSTVTITDDDDIGVIDITPATVSIDESGTTVSLTVTRSAGSDGAASVDVASVDGSATAGTDFAAVADTLTWADGEVGDRTVDITITNDSDPESDEDFTVALSDFVGAAAGAGTQSAVTIVDDDETGVIEIAPAVVSVDEDDIAATLSVTRSNGTDGPATVLVTTNSGSATADDDYTSVSQTLTWADGDDSTKLIEVPIVDDLDEEGAETFTVDLSAVTGATAGSASSSTVTIEESDLPPPEYGVFDIDPSSVSIDEAGTTATVQVTRTGGSDGAASIDIATSAGTADANDYTPISTTLSWADGDSAPKSVSISITDDGDIEDDETFTIALSDPSVGALGSTTSSTITIVDDDETGVIGLLPLEVSLDENGGSISVTVNRSQGSDGAATATITTADGTADTDDYTPISTTIEWADGEEGAKSITIDIADDDLVEDDETFTASITNTTGATTAGVDTTSTITIIDNDDVGVIDLAPATISVDEDGTSVTLTATRSGGSDGAASALVSTTSGTADANDDYTPVSATLTWADGEVGAKSVTIDITDDADEEADETFSVDLTAFAGAIAGANTSSTVTIAANDIPVPEYGTIDLSPAALSVDEDGGTATVTLTRSGGSDGAATASITTTDGTATEGVDYTAPTMTASWDDGENGPKTVTIAITDDAVFEDDETFTAALSDVTTAAVGNDTSTITIVDNDGVGVIDIAPATIGVDEDGTSITLTATRSNGSDGAASALVTTTPGTASENVDYTALSATLAWADGEDGPKSVTIAIIDDGSVEDDETFTANLSNITGATPGTDTTSSITIVDDEVAGVIDLSPVTVDVDESAGTATLILFRSAGSDGPATASITTTDGTAIGGNDYTESSTDSLNWADGEDGPKTITIAITDDASEEDDETFTATLSGVTGATAGTDTTSTITIVDNDDVGVIRLSPADVTVAEDGTSITLTANRSGGSDGAATATITTADGTATAGDDYASTSTTVSWADGEDGPKTVTIAITDDGLVEDDETFTASLSAVTGANTGTAAGTNTSSTITITDDEAAGVLDLGPATLAVDESGTSVILTVTRSGGSDGAASATVTTATGTADADDYTPIITTLDWADGDDGPQTVKIAITDDGLLEGDETFAVSLGAVTGATAGATSSTVTIIDDDVPGVIDLTPATITVDEDGTSVTVTATRSGGTGGTASATITTVAGSAGSDDYSPVTTTLTWADGEAGPKTVTIDITDDDLVEDDETFTVTLGSITGANSGTATSTVVTIIDDEVAGVIDLSPDTLTVDEDAGTATITLTRSGGNDGTATATITTTDGTATEGSDFDAPSTRSQNMSVTWADGEDGPKTITIDITDDATNENDETFTANLSSVTGATAGTNTTSTITIIDNDDIGVISISPASVTVDEDGTSITVTANRAGGSDGAASATITTTNGTATGSDDYSPVTTTLTWANGEDGPKKVTIDITDDDLVEDDETFTVTLGSITGANSGTATSTVVTIIDDEVAGVIDLSPDTLTVDEDAGTATITLTRSGGNDGTATATITTTDGTATEGSDFDAPSTRSQNMSVTWADGEDGPKTITIDITDDATNENDETFTANLSSVTGATAGTNTTSTITIIDNDDIGVISISPAAISVGESDGMVALTVTRSGGTDGAASVLVSTTAGTAGSGDYTSVLNTQTWADGESGSRPVRVFITNDGLLEGDETFRADLGAFSGATAGAVTTSTVTIIDDEQSGVIDIAPASLSVDEDDGTATVTLTRTGGSAGTATARVTTAAGTANSADFTAVDQTVTWADGDASDKTISISIVDDTIEEPTKTFTVQLDDVAGAAAGSGTSSVITIDDDDEAGTLSISPASLFVGESDGFAVLSVNRTGGSDGAVSVRLRTATDTAKTRDFDRLDTTLEWAHGDSASQTVAVPIRTDNLIEGSETFTVALSEFSAAEAGRSTSTVTIVDDDGPGVLTVGPKAMTVDEGVGSIDVSVTRSDGSTGQAFAIVSTENGTADADTDFTTTALIVRWVDGEDGTKTVTVPILDDDESESTETFTVSLSDPTVATVGDVSSTTVTILDNDSATGPDPEPGATSFVTAVAPARVVDTRAVGETVDGQFDKIGAIEAGGTLRVDIANRAGVPGDAKAVVANVTSVRGDGVGFLTVHPCLDTRPGASSLNFDGANTPNEIIAGLNVSGSLCVYSSVDTDVLIDVVGYIAAESDYAPLPPARILETRPGKSTVDGQTAGVGSLDGGQTFELPVLGRAGVSADATAVVVNVTSIKAPANGFVTVHPCLDDRPGASSLNFSARSNRANEIIAEVSDAGTICLFASSETGLLVDVVGQLTPSTGYTPVSPARLVDTRAAGSTVDGAQQQIGRRPAGSILIVDVAERAKVPTSADAVVVNLTAVRPAGGGFFTTFDCGDLPNASALNYSSANVANELIVELNDDGQFCLYTSTDSDVLIDVVGHL